LKKIKNSTFSKKQRQSQGKRSGKKVASLLLSPLRTVLDSFPSYGSSLSTAICNDRAALS